MARLLVALFAIALTVYALTDLSNCTDRRPGGVPKAVWTALILVLPIFGPIAWILAKRATMRPSAGEPLAPDDDPDFLWRLERDRRRNQGGTPGPEGP